MNLKKIEIYGFKSFFSRTEINLKEGITAIVGPNGCGKSNVADAIRWVFGEQSSKTLRGSSMVDVIFNGSSQRKALSYAEVSLFFDNQDKTMPYDYSEVVITRKLYRSGESVYKINNSDCRLKDIIELVRNCNLGREGYSIIGQGRVEQFINSKPEERRYIFDEATGIASAKQKKNEAERKLDRTKTNLIRYKDIIFEIENQLGPLEKQSINAKKYFILKDKLKYNEVNFYLYKKASIDKELSDLTGRVNEINEEIKTKEKNLFDATESYQKILSEMDLSDEKAKSLRDEQLKSSLLRANLDSEKKLNLQRKDYIIKNSDDLKRQIEIFSSENEKLIEEKNSLISQKEQLSKISHEIECEINEKKEKREKINVELDNLLHEEKRVLELEGQFNLDTLGVQNEIAKTVFEKNAIEKGNIEREEKHQNLLENLESVVNEKSKFSHDLEKNKISLTEKQNELNKLKSEVSLKRENLEKVNNNLNILERRKADKETKLKFTHQMKESREGLAGSVKRLLFEGRENRLIGDKIQGVMADIISVPKGLENAIDAALGNAIHNIVTKNYDDAKSLIAHLREKNYGMATFLPMESVKPRFLTQDNQMALEEMGAIGRASELVSFDPKFSRVVESLLGAIVVVDTIDNGIKIARKYGSSFKMVTQNGEIFATSGSVAGGSLKAKISNVFAYANDIETYENEIEGITKQENEQHEIKAKIASSLASLEKLLNKLLEENKLMEFENQKLTNGIFHLGQEMVKIQRELEILEDENQKKSQEFETLTVKLVDLEEFSTRMNSEKHEDNQKRNDLSTMIDALSKEDDEVSNLINELKLDYVKNENKLEIVISNLEKLQDKISENTENIMKSQSFLEKNAVKILEIENMVYHVITDQELEKIAEEIKNLEKSKKNFAQNLASVDERRNSLAIEVQKLINKRDNLNENLGKTDQELEILLEKIIDEYGLTENFDHLKDENFKINQAKGEIRKTKEAISSLGNINLDSVEDFKNLKERYDELVKHRDDMLNAESDLAKSISGLTKEMNEKFDETFTLIDKNFNKTFVQLFGGGRARLRIIENDSGDKLNYGIDIEAEPPGKSLQNMTLLSGGEKALTAIAIIIAIMKIRPMPLCVFDEIEAALDDVNCFRFASYIKKMATNTQFLLITHKKTTMEIADKLYGVTMEEKGLSKLVSVSLQDVK